MFNEIDPATGLPFILIRVAWFIGLTLLAYAIAIPWVLSSVKRKTVGPAEEATPEP